MQKPPSSKPILEMLDAYEKSKSVRLHTPAHSGSLHGWDITELPFSDDLANPQGVIRQSQELFASSLNVNHAIYLTQGSTLGNWAMIKCAVGTVLVERNSHISVFNALETLKMPYVIVNNDIVDGLPQPVTLEQIAKTTEENPDIKTVLLTSPNYFGIVAEIRKIYSFLKSKNIVFFIDSAHGAAFGYTDLLPEFAANCCSACVVSLHKSLPCFTGGAVIFTNDAALSVQLKKAVNIFSSTSPSYLILSGIDFARSLMEKADSNFWERHYADINAVKSAWAERGVRTLKNDDFFKIVIDCSNLGLSGKAFSERLSEKGVVAEMHFDCYVLLIIPLNIKAEQLSKLTNSVLSVERGTEKILPLSYRYENTYLRPAEKFRKTEMLALEKSEGRISAETIIGAVPCVPLVVKGEKISLYIVSRLIDKTAGIEVEVL